MKTTLIFAASIAAATAFATPSTNTFAAVTNDWYNANFTNVYELAQSRLAANTNDVVGAYLMLDWDLAFSSIETMSNAVTRVLCASDMVTQPAFTNVYLRLGLRACRFATSVSPSNVRKNASICS